MVSFPHVSPTKPCTHLSSPPIRATCHANLMLLDFITRIIFVKQYRLVSSTLCRILHCPVTSSLTGRNILLSSLFLNTLLAGNNTIKYITLKGFTLKQLHILSYRVLESYFLFRWTQCNLTHYHLFFMSLRHEIRVLGISVVHLTTQ
jgi:hypothetical protein